METTSQQDKMVARQREDNVTLIAAIAKLIGLFYYEIHVTSATKEAFISMALLSAVLGPDGAVNFMDEAHAGPENKGRVIKRIPLLSPFLDPFEKRSSVLKTSVKRLTAAMQVQHNDKESPEGRAE